MDHLKHIALWRCGIHVHYVLLGGEQSIISETHCSLEVWDTCILLGGEQWII